MLRTSSSAVVLAAVLSIAGLSAACVGRTAAIRVPDTAPPRETLAQLWVDPGTAPRDLFWGVGGERYAPAPDVVYAFEGRDDVGFSASYDVEDPKEVEWSAKIGPEAQTEVVVSRILWGLGYHQPPLYYLPSWRLDDGGTVPRLESEARFRPKLDRLDRKRFWRWADNPFLGAREFRGLLVVLLMLNSTDLKDDNNSVYELREPWDGAARWFVVRDVGAALGDTGKLFPRRNWLAAFEREPFISRVDGNRVEIHYKGRHAALLSILTADDIRWASQRLQRFTPGQWRDAFRAGNYAPADAERFIRRIQEKIDDGLMLRVDRRLRERD